jgi:hypothetical protein
MSNWSSGYVTQIDYTHGYYRELCPPIISLAVFNRSVRARRGEPFRYLELGFGQGVSLNIHAAACPGEYWGVDFNPSHAANALDLAEASGSGARIFDLSFAELAARPELPEFDVIALHGIWSWISDENRAIIVDIARRKLAVGGLFYVSYNCAPGWAAAAPLRHLMALHAELAGSEAQGMAAKIDGSLAFSKKIADSGAQYFKANPAVAARLESIQKQNRNYLAHEYLNRDWHPMPFSEVAGLLSEAKLELAASAHLLDHVDNVTLGREGWELIASVSHPVLRETARDYFLNQQFRRDIFIKGSHALAPLERLERYAKRRFVLTTPAADVPLKVTGPRGEINLLEVIYKPLIDILAQDNYAPKVVERILSHAAWKGQNIATLIQCLVILCGAGHAAPVQDPRATDEARPRCQKLNAHIRHRARCGGDIAHLASPMTGGAVAVGRFQQLFLQARAAGQAQAPQWASFAWNVLQRQGQRIVKDGKPLETAEQNLAELTEQAIVFAEKQIPLLKALGIAD